MAQYSTMVITELGKILYAKSQTGKPLIYTKMQIGSGQISGDPTNFTSLVQPIGNGFPISGFSRNGDTAVVKAVFQNTGITTTTYACELGIFAMDPDVGEILYSYANAGSKGDWIPPESAGTFSREYDMLVVVGSAPNVTANILPEAYVTWTDFEDHVNNTDIHVPKSYIDANIQNLQNQIDTIKATFPDSFNNNLFDDSLATLDEILVTHGYYNEAYERLEV